MRVISIAQDSPEIAGCEEDSGIVRKVNLPLAFPNGRRVCKGDFTWKCKFFHAVKTRQVCAGPTCCRPKGASGRLRWARPPVELLAAQKIERLFLAASVSK